MAVTRYSGNAAVQHSSLGQLGFPGYDAERSRRQLRPWPMTIASKAHTVSADGITAPLRHITFRRIWLASLLSNLGILIQGVGAAWAMTQMTSSADKVALVRFAVGSGMALMGPAWQSSVTEPRVCRPKSCRAGERYTQSDQRHAVLAAFDGRSCRAMKSRSSGRSEMSISR
jgi:hypothetical protein